MICLRNITRVMDKRVISFAQFYYKRHGFNLNTQNTNVIHRSKSIFARYEPSPVIFESEIQVPLSGTVEIETPFNVELAPMDMGADVQKYDMATFKVIVIDGNADAMKNNCSFKTELVDSSCVFKGTSTDNANDAKVFCLGELPVQNDVTTTLTGDGSFVLQDMESKNVIVHTDSGHITCKRLKCEQIKCHSRSGDIQCPGVMHGNIDIKTRGNGKVTGVRFQGQQVNVETEKGSVDVSAIYAEISSFRSVSGQMDLDNYHGNGTVKLKEGSINITGLDGSLRAEVESGDITVQVSRLEGLYLVNKNGKVDVKLPTNIRCRVELEGKDIFIEKRLQVQGQFKKKDNLRTFSGFLGVGKGPLIIILAPQGSINITIQDWMSSLALGGVIPEIRPEEPTNV